jgi:hypothetical protein
MIISSAMTAPEHLLLIFERSPDESQLSGVGEAIRALEQNDIDVKLAAQNPRVEGLIGSVLRFWFPYLSSAGVVGVTPGAGLGPAAEVGEFIVALSPVPAPVFGTVLGAWLQARYGRRIRVKFNDIEIEAQTPGQVESLLSQLEALRQNRKPAQSVKQ